MKLAIAAIALAATGAAADKAVPRVRNPLGLLGFQPAYQASLPNEVHINYDVPTYGAMAAAKYSREAANAAAVASVNEASEAAQLGAAQSFMKLRGSRSTDVFFENAPLATATEASYQSILSSLESSLDQDLAALRASAQGSLRAGQSFLKIFPAREPQMNIQVDASRGELVDVARLRSDLYAYAKGKLDQIEAEILRSA